jgi:phosphate starvation-inducible protein PhoH and related proteins
MPSQNNRRQRRKKENTYQNRTPEITRLFAKNNHQQDLINSINKNAITIAVAPAGCGKTLLALHEGVWMLEAGVIDKIIYVKPVVDFAGDKGIGFLPGTVDEKIAPLLLPVLDNISVFTSPGKARYLLDKKQIEYQLLEYVRGRSLRKTLVIADEMQNSNKHTALTLISRLENSSKLVMLGDPRQSDIGLKDNAITDAKHRLKNLSDVGIIEFNTNDIVRSSFLKHIIARYDQI